MNYYFCSIFLIISQVLTVLPSLSIFPINIVNLNIRSNNSIDFQKEESNILQNLCNLEQSLINIFPFLAHIECLCAELNIKTQTNQYKSIDCINFGECKKIKSFKLKGCNIRCVPSYIKSFTSICDLNFFENQLSISCFDTITQLTTLKSLDLGFNFIDEIPRSILKLINLKYLYISACMVTDVPEFLTNFQLKKLDLSGIYPFVDQFNIENEKEDIIMKLINDFLKIKTLDIIRLSFNKLKSLNFYNENYNIKKIELNDNNLSDLPTSILKFKNLEYLNLTSNNFMVVPSILGRLESLKELNIRNNPIKSCKSILFYSLETLRISFTREYDGIDFSTKTILYPIQHLHIYINLNTRRIFSEIYRMVELKTLWIFGPVMFRENDKIYELEKLELLYLNSLIINDYIDLLFRLKNLKALCLNLHSHEVRGYSQNFFYGLTKLKKLEYLSIKDFNRRSMLNNKIFDLENLKKLELGGFHINNIEGFSRFINLKYLLIENSIFKNSRDKIIMGLKRFNRRIRLKTSRYDSKSS